MTKKFQVPGFRFQVDQPQLETWNLKLAVGALSLAAVLAAWPLRGAAQISAAQILYDPMRPPAELDATPGEKGAGGAPRLQSVMIGPSERWAIIGGERVGLGGRYGDSRVVRITESEVVLRSASGDQMLKMYSDIEMNPVKPAAAALKNAARKRRDRQ